MSPSASILAATLTGEMGLRRVSDAGVLRLGEYVAMAWSQSLTAPLVDDLTNALVLYSTEQREPAVVGVLLAFLGECEKHLRDVDGAAADALASRLRDAHEQLGGARVDVTKVLTSAVRPAGTTPAGPMARFAVNSVKKSEG
jgi:hypothetical protein